MYREAIITFVDILGFKSIIQNSSPKEVLKMLKTIGDYSGIEESTNGEDYSPKIFQFSDSIIRIRPLDSKANADFRYGLMFHELNDLLLMQGELLNNGILIRGGTTIGKVFFDDKNIFGPGFVRAYEIESVFANYPRIVVDPELIARAKADGFLVSEHNDLQSELKFISDQLRRDSDGLHFIDYLGGMRRNIDDADMLPAFFENSKNLIISNISKKNDLSGVTLKYLWFAMYHNQALDETFKRNEDTEELWITSAEVPLLSSVL